MADVNYSPNCLMNCLTKNYPVVGYYRLFLTPEGRQAGEITPPWRGL